MFRNFAPRLMSSLLALLVAVAFVSISALAQSQATTGDIEGRVLDPNGAVIPGVTVTATNQATGLEKRATSDEDGNYRIILLPPGSYAVKTSAPSGFQAADYSNVPVTVGGKTPLEINTHECFDYHQRTSYPESTGQRA